MAAIEMYTKRSCPFCDAAKRLLASKGQTWSEIDIEADSARRDEMIRRSGRRTVPQIFIPRIAAHGASVALQDAAGH